MSSTPLEQQAPPAIIAQQSYSIGSGHGSIGAVVAVLVVIVILGVVAGMIGRLCSGRSVMGYGQYDIESWAEAKCSTCIDGRITIAPPRGVNVSGSSTPVSLPSQTRRETKRDESESESPTRNAPPPPNDNVVDS